MRLDSYAAQISRMLIHMLEARLARTCNRSVAKSSIMFYAIHVGA